jgi:hypothetical protein
MHVPVDDTHTYWYSFFTSFAEPLDKGPMRAQRLACVTLPDTRRSPRPPRSLGLRCREPALANLPRNGRGRHQPARPVGRREHGAVQDRTPSTSARAKQVIMANRRTLAKAIETVRAGGRPPMALAAADAAASDRARHDRLHRPGRTAGRNTGPRPPAPSDRRRRGWRRQAAARRAAPRPRPSGEPARRAGRCRDAAARAPRCEASPCASRRGDRDRSRRLGDLHGVLRRQDAGRVGASPAPSRAVSAW